MDKQIVTQKLELLRRCIDRIAEKSSGSFESFENDLDAQDVLVLNLTRAVQLCVDISLHIVSNSESKTPETMGQVFVAMHKLEVLDTDLALRLKKAVGFRNIAVHNYKNMELSIVFSIATNDLNDFKQFAQAVTTFCSL